MKLYEIDQQLQTALDSIEIDEETGEVIGNLEAVEELGIAREEKIEGILLHIKNATAEAAAIRAEEISLAKRRQTLEKKTKCTKDWLQGYLDGEKFKTSRVSVSYRTSAKAEVSEEFFAWAYENYPDLLRYKEPEPDKTAISKLLKSGTELYGCKLVNSTSIIIK